MITMTYEVWLVQVQEALKSINMSLGDWQPVWPLDFSSGNAQSRPWSC